jgi:hypothetical protein
VNSDRLQRAQAVAAAGERLAATHGVNLPADLRLWALAGGQQVATPCGPGASTAAPDVDLAAALEAATSPRQRRSRGLHVTPAWLADQLVGLVIDAAGARPAACDPACGGGAFLLAVARALHARGVPRAQVVEEMLWGADIDPVGLAAAEAALAIWSGGAVPPPGRLVVGDPLLAGADLWPERPPAGFDLVVGNPPFQNQLGKATVRAAEARRDLRRVFGPAVRAYTDTAWLFLLLGCRLARPGGRVVMVQPDSLAAARDAAAVREAVDALAHLENLWVDDRQVFEAAVRVCAPVLRRYEGGAPVGAAGDTGAGGEPAVGGAEPERWHDLLADATGIPALRVAGRGRLADRAATLAGFRDEYYGLAALVRDATPAERAGPGAGGGEGRALVTVGSIDWGRLAWGRRPVRFAKRRWEAPVVELARVEADATPAARRWVSRTAVPKLLIATQTRVVEAAVDERGDWVPSVPVIVVVPRCPEDLWPLAAAVLSPAASVWLSRRSPGVALARGALKVAARDLADLPLPADAAAWAAAAAALQAYVLASDGPGPGAATRALDAFSEAAAAAYGSPPAVVRWWRERLDAVLAG